MFILVGIRKWFSSVAGKLFVECRALIRIRNNIVKSQCLGSILLFRVALGTPTLGPNISEKEVYDIV